MFAVNEDMKARLKLSLSAYLKMQTYTLSIIPLALLMMPSFMLCTNDLSWITNVIPTTYHCSVAQLVWLCRCAVSVSALIGVLALLWPNAFVEPEAQESDIHTDA